MIVVATCTLEDSVVSFPLGFPKEKPRKKLANSIHNLMEKGEDLRLEIVSFDTLLIEIQLLEDSSSLIPKDGGKLIRLSKCSRSSSDTLLIAIQLLEDSSSLIRKDGGKLTMIECSRSSRCS